MFWTSVTARLASQALAVGYEDSTMTRIRRLSLASGLVTLTLLLASPVFARQQQAQQPQGGGPGGGGRGGPGGRGGFGGGFPGFGGGLLGLASNGAVQDDIKADKEQKAEIAKLTESQNKRMQEMRAKMGFGARGNRQAGGANAPAGQGNPAAGQAAGGFGPGGFAPGQGGGGFAPGQGGGGGGFGPGQGGGGGFAPGQGGPGQGGPGGRGNRPQPTPEQIQQMTMMRQAMDESRQSGELALAQILSKGQYNRLKQIQLQLDGPRVLVRPDMIEKLQLDEFQVQSLQDLMSQERTASREARNNRGQIFRMAMESVQGANAGGQQPLPGGQAGGGQAGGGQQAGGRGGPGGRPNFELIQKAMQKPEIQTKMQQLDKLEERIREQFAASVLKVLSKRQRSNYAKMLGAPFDRTKMGGGPPWAGGRGGPGATTKGATTTNTKASPGEDEDEAAAKPAATTPAKTPATAKPKRKSLRESRGIGTSPQ